MEYSYRTDIVVGENTGFKNVKVTGDLLHQFCDVLSSARFQRRMIRPNLIIERDDNYYFRVFQDGKMLFGVEIFTIHDEIADYYINMPSNNIITAISGHEEMNSFLQLLASVFP